MILYIKIVIGFLLLSTLGTILTTLYLIGFSALIYGLIFTVLLCLSLFYANKGEMRTAFKLLLLFSFGTTVALVYNLNWDAFAKFYCDSDIYSTFDDAKSWIEETKYFSMMSIGIFYLLMYISFESNLINKSDLEQ